jgi:hypothetical protein
MLKKCLSLWHLALSLASEPLNKTLHPGLLFLASDADMATYLLCTLCSQRARQNTWQPSFLSAAQD